MSRSSRRSFLSAVGAIPFSAWLAGRGLGRQPAAPRVRCEARTPQGIQMLQVYSAAVETMKQTAAGDPRSWTFQWYTHWVNGDTTKAAAITPTGT